MKNRSCNALHPLLLLPFLLLCGCATIIHGSKQKIGISSSPTGAKVSIDSTDFGVTPMFAKLSRRKEHIVRIEMKGYQIAEFTITKSTSPWILGNILIGGLIGLAVDAASGGIYELSPDQLNAELKKNDMGSVETNEGTLRLLTVLKPDPAWHRIGQLEPAH